MKIKFNKYERVAGLFVGSAIAGSVLMAAFIAIKQGIFESKVELVTHFKAADGLTPGAAVHMSGLKIGAVEDVLLENENDIVVRFYVKERYLEKIREDSVVRAIRPFIIGDKVLDISMGNPQQQPVHEHSIVKSEETLDLMGVIGGRGLGNYLSSVGSLVENLRIVAEAFADPERSQAIIRIFDSVNPLLRDMGQMSREVVNLTRAVSKKNNLERAVDNLVTLTDHLNQVMPVMVATVQANPNLSQDLSQMLTVMAQLTNEMGKLIPTMSALAPELPRASRRAIEAMDEAVVLLKAMQKSFLMSGNVKEVREEEDAKRRKEMPAENGRSPASEP